MNLLVNSKISGCLIGKGRAIKDEMENEFDCKMFVDREEKDGSSEKLVKLNGEGDNVFKMICSISDKLIKRIEEGRKRDNLPEGFGENLWKPQVPQRFLEPNDDDE